MSKQRKYEAWRSPKLFEDGLGTVVVARFKGSGEAEMGVFLLDVFCLGVKNAFFTRAWPEELQETLDRIFTEGSPVSLSAACGRKLVEEAVAYARDLGLAPHKDYKKAARVFGGIDAQDCMETFTFGSEGKPFYFQGPNDSPWFAKRVLETLRTRCGPDGYHYVLPVGSLGDEATDEVDEEDEGEA